MVDTTPVVVALKTTVLILGGLITYFAWKAYRRTDAAALRALAIGFGTVTLGSLLGGVVDQLLSIGNTHALAIESALTAIGFAIILYSLYAD